MTDQLPLPKEIVGVIDDMVCTKRSNGGESKNLLVMVNTARGVDPESVEKEVVQWVLRGLSDPRFDYLKDEMNQYQWKVVSTVKDDGSANNESEDESEGEGEGGEEGEEGEEAAESQDNDQGCIAVAVHIFQNGDRWSECELDDTGLIVVDESPPLTKAKADDVLEALPTEPACVTGVGVSAVSDKLMMELWADLVSTESNTFDKNGMGYMVHPMWMRMHDGGWTTVREQSFNFGWDGYKGGAMD